MARNLARPVLAGLVLCRLLAITASSTRLELAERWSETEPYASSWAWSETLRALRAPDPYQNEVDRFRRLTVEPVSQFYQGRITLSSSV